MYKNKYIQKKNVLNNVHTKPNFSFIMRLAFSICSVVPRITKVFSEPVLLCRLSISQCAPVCILICLIVSPPKIKNNNKFKKTIIYKNQTENIPFPMITPHLADGTVNVVSFNGCV